MTDFDGNEYERRQNEAARAAGLRLKEVVALDQWGFGPAVEFLCPRGHSLKRYRAQLDDETLILAALPGMSSKSGPTTRNGSPWQRARTVCESLRCPNLTPCSDHPQQSEEVHMVRTEFVCSCGWSDAFTMARLIKVYGSAVVLKFESIPVTFSEASARRSGRR